VSDPDEDTVKRPPGCLCQWEQGDSPCLVHPSEDDLRAELARVTAAYERCKSVQEATSNLAREDHDRAETAERELARVTALNENVCRDNERLHATIEQNGKDWTALRAELAESRARVEELEAALGRVRDESKDNRIAAIADDALVPRAVG
jgi:predicted RNase H-like nuclease (RuvC/YqgF family)